MLTVFLSCLDQFRAVAGLMAACFLFCHNAVPRRERFGLRTASCSFVCLAVGFAYVPLSPLMAALPRFLYGLTAALYWLTLTGMICSCTYFCFEISACNAAFRGFLGCTVEATVTTVVRYLLVMMWLPNLPERTPVIYILLTVAIYSGLYYMAYLICARFFQQGGTTLDDRINSFRTYVFIILAFSLIMYSTNGICEWVLPSMGDDPTLHLQYRLIQYFCVGIRLLVSTAFLVTQYFVYKTDVLEYERDMVNQLMKEKSAQYEFSRENIEFIRHKCHDLKRQLRALELAGEDERRTVIEETWRAAEFYDAQVYTGSEVMDTLLTEKNLLCVNRGIRLTCTVRTQKLDRIGVVDLYTMLSNALDNAIECVERLKEPNKRTISFSVTERGKLLFIAVENYYEGTIRMRDGVPETRKADKVNHGIGVKSIRTLAKRYGGDIRIATENQLFLLQIMLPLSQLGEKR